MERVDTAKIISDLDAQGIKAILVGYVGETKSIQIKGDFGDFIAAVKAFNENVVFFQEFSFDEDDFIYELKKLPVGNYEIERDEEGINLAQFLPELNEYKKYIGQKSLLIFRVFYRNHVFAYWHKTKWFEDFTNLFDQAENIFEEKEKILKEQQLQAQLEAQEQAERRVNHLLGLLEQLSEDEKFVTLKTQKAMQEYALARFSELSDLSQHILKEGVSNLNAKIQAKKLLQ